MDTPHDMFRRRLAEENDPIAALKVIRERFGLTVAEAKDVWYQVTTGKSLSEHQAGLAEAIVFEATEQSAAEHLSRGESALSQNAYSQAIAEFRTGIAAIGNAYVDLKVIDDSGLKMIAADGEERAARLNTAANLLRNVLSSRISQLRARAPK